MDVDALRSEFPVLEQIAYLNAGSNGPVPRRAVEAAEAQTSRALERGRGSKAHWEENEKLKGKLRERLARLLGAGTDRVAITTSTTGGVNTVLQGLELGPGDVILTTDEEHPGLLAPLAAARAAHGVEIRTAPFDRIGEAVAPDVSLVACSHVSWLSGQIVDSRALAAAAAPVLLDGAQALGAVAVDVEQLGCDFYAASGQKWLCGPEGTGSLFVREPEELGAAFMSYSSLADSLAPLELRLRPGAARFDAYALPAFALAWALASVEVLEGHGIEGIQTRAAARAAGLAQALADGGLTVAPRGPSTLVAWQAEDNESEAARLLAEGLLVRHIPGTPWVRASVGGWTSDEEISRLATSSTRA